MTNTIDQDLIDDAKAAGATMTYACKFRRSEECPCEVKETEECEGKEFYEARLTLEKLAKFAQLQRERQAQPTPSQSVDERAEFEKALINQGYCLSDLIFLKHGKKYQASYIHDMWWAWQARSNLSKPQPANQDMLDVDTVGLIASREILKVITQHGIEIYEGRKSLLQAKIQCAVIEAIESYCIPDNNKELK